MQTVDANKILNAIEAGNLESILDDGYAVVLLNLDPVLSVPFLPTPQVRVEVDNSVSIMSEHEQIVRIETESVDDAHTITETLATLIEFAR